MHFHQYFAQAEKQYHLRLKTVIPLDDAMMDRIEMAIAKHMPVFISKPMKTIIQRQPMEFPDIHNAEIYIVDMTFGMPVAPPVLRDDIRLAMQAPDSFVFVRNQYSPGELEIERLNALADIEAQAAEQGLTAVAVLDDSDYNEVDSHDVACFGNAYNAAFLSYLSKVQKERTDINVKVQNAPFNWLDIPKQTDTENDVDFNASIADAPKVAPQGIETPEVNRSIYGHYTVGSEDEVRKLYTDGNGNRVVLTRKLFGDVQ